MLPYVVNIVLENNWQIINFLNESCLTNEGTDNPISPDLVLHLMRF